MEEEDGVCVIIFNEPWKLDFIMPCFFFFFSFGCFEESSLDDCCICGEITSPHSESTMLSSHSKKRRASRGSEWCSSADAAMEERAIDDEDIAAKPAEEAREDELEEEEDEDEDEVEDECEVIRDGWKRETR